MSANQAEYVIRTKPLHTGGFIASLRRFAGTAHPEVRAIVGATFVGYGATEPAAMLAAICSSRIETVPPIREVTR